MELSEKLYHFVRISGKEPLKVFMKSSTQKYLLLTLN